jgi:uncharacterized membrane protein YkvA (DUF1232 family)
MWMRIWRWVQMFREELLVLFIAVRNPATPKSIKFLFLLAVGYLLSPIGFILDTIPVVGLMDDMVIVPALLYYIMRRLPPSVRQDSEMKVRRLGRKLAYIFLAVAVFFVIWMVFIFWVIYSLLIK